MFYTKQVANNLTEELNRYGRRIERLDRHTGAFLEGPYSIHTPEPLVDRVNELEATVKILLDYLGVEKQTECKENLPKIVKKSKK